MIIKRLGWFFLGISTSAISIALIGLGMKVADSSWSRFTNWVSLQTFGTPGIINILENMPDFLQLGIGFFAYVIPLLLGMISCVLAVCCFYKTFVPHTRANSDCSSCSNQVSAC